MSASEVITGVCLSVCAREISKSVYTDLNKIVWTKEEMIKF